MHHLANDELKKENCAAILTLYIQLSCYTACFTYILQC
jgi:hypothetical protein